MQDRQTDSISVYAGQTDRQTETTKLTAAFHSCSANML